MAKLNYIDEVLGATRFIIAWYPRRDGAHRTMEFFEEGDARAVAKSIIDQGMTYHVRLYQVEKVDVIEAGGEN